MDIFNSIGTAINAITNNSFTGKLMLSCGTLLTAFFTPIVGLLFACFSLNIVDLISGIKAARVQGLAITSRKTWKGTISKLIMESELIVALHIIEHFTFPTVGIETTILSGGAAILICLTEIWSFLENLNRINPKGPWRIIKTFLEKKSEQITGIEIDLNNDGTVNSVKPVSSEELAAKS